MQDLKAQLQFLGTGTSQGVPIIACNCPVCQSSDARDKRLRSSALVSYAGLNILIDAGPDFRQQMLSAKVEHLDAILLTHNHKDHTGGLDDVRALNYVDRKAIKIYCEEGVLKTLKQEYSYAFEEFKYPGAPEWQIFLIENKEFYLSLEKEEGDLVWVHDKGYFYQMPDGSLRQTMSKQIISAYDESILPQKSNDRVLIQTIRGYHDKMPVLGYRFGNIAYITDMSSIPEEEFAKLQGLEHLSLNTVGYKKHHSHFSLDEALSIADKVAAKHTWLTHLSHAFPSYDSFAEELKALCLERNIASEVAPAYDGLIIR